MCCKAAAQLVSVINSCSAVYQHYKQNKLSRLVYDDSRQLECPCLPAAGCEHEIWENPPPPSVA